MFQEMLSRAETVVAMICPHSDLAGSASQSSTLQGITVLQLMSVGARSSVLMMHEQGLETPRADIGRRGCAQVKNASNWRWSQHRFTRSSLMIFLASE